MGGPFQEMSIVTVRATRLTDDGTPDFNNAQGAFALCGGLQSLEFDHEVNEGQEFFELDGRGNPCVNLKRHDVVKRTTFTLTVCTRDHRFEDVLGVADPVVALGGEVIGKVINVSEGCGTGAAPTGVALEFWSEQVDCTGPNDDPFLRAIMPRAFLTPKGFTKENGVAKPVYTGFSIPNPNFGDGPFGDLDQLEPFTGWSYAELDDAALPSCPDPLAYIPTPSGAS